MTVLECLKKYGQRLDREIAEETGMPLDYVRVELKALASVGAVIMCELTRYEGGQPLASWQCRVSGYTPPKAPGRKTVTTAPTVDAADARLRGSS